MIELESVEKRFAGDRTEVVAVDGLSLAVPAGTFCTLLGPSGCGKTTALRCVAGLERPDRGRVRVGGHTVFSSEERIDVPPHKRGIGMVFQSHALWPHLDVSENVAYPLRVRGLRGREVARRVDAALELVGLGGLGERASTRLSGGQQQRVALARALVAEPSVLLLDEPLSSLDANLRAQLQVELKDLQRRLGVTTLYVTHDRREALAMSDEVVVLAQGAILQRGTPRDIYLRPRDRYTAELAGAVNLVPVIAKGPVPAGRSGVATPMGTIEVEAADAHETGSGLFVCIRPEMIDIEPAHGASAHRGVVERAVFRGASTMCDVRVGSITLHVRADPRREVAVGDEVGLVLAPQHCRVIADQLR